MFRENLLLTAVMILGAHDVSAECSMRVLQIDHLAIGGFQAVGIDEIVFGIYRRSASEQTQLQRGNTLIEGALGDPNVAPSSWRTDLMPPASTQ